MSHDDEPVFSPPFSFDAARRPQTDGQASGGAEAPAVAPERRLGARSLTILTALESKKFAPGAGEPVGAKAASGSGGGMRNVAGLALALALGAGLTLLWTGHRDAAAEAQANVETLKHLSARLDLLESKPRGDDTDTRKLAADMKSTIAANRDLSAALAQMSTRLDKVDRDQNAKLDKLSQRFDKDSTGRIADTSANKPEKQAGLEVTPAPPQPAGATPQPPARSAAPVAATKPDVGVSTDTTGSIERPRTPMAGYAVIDVRDGVALLQTPAGPQEVSPGDYLPGIGRVQRIEKHGKEWSVVTSLGVVQSE